MADNQSTYRRDVRGRFTRPVANVDAESRFDVAGNSVEDIKDISAADMRPGMEIPRFAPAADELAQGGQRSPLRARNPTLVHPDDEDYFNGVLRTAVRRSGSAGMDPTAYLVGLESRGTPVTG